MTLPSECVLHNGLVVGDIDPRSRRGGGSVEIAAAIPRVEVFLGPALPPPAFAGRSISASLLERHLIRKRVVWAVLCEGVRVKCPHNLCGHLFMRVAV